MTARRNVFVAFVASRWIWATVLLFLLPFLRLQFLITAIGMLFCLAITVVRLWDILDDRLLIADDGVVFEQHTVWNRQRISIPADAIQEVRTRTTLLLQILGTGHLTLSHANGEVTFTYMADINKIADAIQSLQKGRGKPPVKPAAV